MFHIESHLREINLLRGAWGRWLVFMASVFLLSCHEHHYENPEPHVSRQTVILFMPWSTNMKNMFDENINDFKEAIAYGALEDERVLVCVATDKTHASIIELYEADEGCISDTLFRLDNVDFTHSVNIAKMLSLVASKASSKHYSLIVGGHGMAWLPVEHIATFAAPPYTSRPITRYFGGLTADTQIDVGALAEGIATADMHMDYILFDNCYMASVEVAYQLREVTDYLIGCPSEIMAYGFPYHLCASYLVGNVDFQRLCDTFHDFYNNYFISCGTIGVINCCELEQLASVTRTIHAKYLLDFDNSDDIQSMDGYFPPLFLDMGDTYDHICKDSFLLARFHEQLARTVPYKSNTESFYSVYSGYHDIHHFSGITTSEISQNSIVIDNYPNTEWYRATH